MAESTNLLSLPPEIIDQICSLLPPTALIRLSQTSHQLQEHAGRDFLWARLIKESVPNHRNVASPAPCASWRELYISHFPYWFLPRNKIWFSDKAHSGSDMTGNLVLTRYDPRTSCIEGYRLVAEHGTHKFESWDHDPDVIIHTFSPKVSLWLDDPVIKLKPQERTEPGCLMQETFMHTGASQAIRSRIFLCVSIPQARQDPSMALWPPAIVPNTQRVRAESPSMFQEEACKPKSMRLASDHTFRLRKWIDFRGSGQLEFRMGESVMTFSTLLEESYTPTKKKPWQGIWVGDYSGHGCEFLMVLQKDVGEGGRPVPSNGPAPRPQTLDEQLELAAYEQAVHYNPHSVLHRVDSPSAEKPELEADKGSSRKDEPRDGACSGRLEAIKLTGDPNVPRGEYTWIAEDIGPKGLIRVATEPRFSGARIVRSWGHTAARGFRNDGYISSQLIMIDHNTLAQYWEDFGHISFYKRINIDEFLDP